MIMQMDYEKIAKRIEKDKAKFVGNEIEGKTLGVIGLGAIGGKVVNAALALGMNVVGFDPVLSLDAALMLPGDRMVKANNLDELLRVRSHGLWGVPPEGDYPLPMMGRMTVLLSRKVVVTSGSSSISPLVTPIVYFSFP